MLFSILLFYGISKSKHFKDHKVTIMALNLSSYNFLAERARELFKLSKEAECLLGSIYKDPDHFLV